MVRRTKEEAEATRVQLLDAAEKVFCDKGVASTTLDDVARCAGLTRGAVYWHFRNKADLFEEVCNRATLPMGAILTVLAETPGEDPLGELKRDAVRILRLLAEDQRLQRVFELKECKMDCGPDFDAVRERERESNTDCLRKITLVLQAAIERGQLPAHVNAADAAIALEIYVMGIMRVWVTSRCFDLARLAGWMMDSFFTGLAHAPACPSAAPAA